MAGLDVSKTIKSTTRAIPTIYAYTTPEVPSHDGWTKIGYTEQDVDTRIRQQTHTADIAWRKEWQGNAIYDDGSGDTFRDTDFHDYLRKLDYENKPRTEWFYISGSESQGKFFEFRVNRGSIEMPGAMAYELRAEQRRAVEETADYAHLHENGEFLWNAKPRFGKTLSAYDLCKKMEARTVLIVTNRPAIANSWYDDYVRFVGLEGGYHFISNAGSLDRAKHAKTRDEYLEYLRVGREPKNFIAFVSLQDLKGSIYFGGEYEKLEWITQINWDVLIVDEAHEGVDTFKTDVAFDHVHRKFTLHLSGTPFKALANEKFPEDAIFNWTYADEQEAKRNWADDELPNPYSDLPQLNMFTYKMSDIVAEEVSQGVEIDGQTVEYAFDLNEFFATNDRGNFVHNDDVGKFLDALTEQKKFPFSTPELRDELKHTLWMLDRVDSARALAKKLKNHPVFGNGEYGIVLAAGDGKIDDTDEVQQSFDKVKAAIATHDKTITLSVGQLTTGVTVPEWTAVLMLSNMKSPSLYMQAAFRAQNPCLFYENGGYLRKQNAYVFDFDPARTLVIFEQFANDLYSDTAKAKGDLDARKRHVLTLLNFFPVYGEDEAGEMMELDAEQVLSVPRRIRSREVVKRGFMSDFLFQNISNVFHAPAKVIELIQNFEPFKAPNKDLGIEQGATAEELSLNAEGNVEIPEQQAIGLAADLFGDKVYGAVEEDLGNAIDEIVSKGKGGKNGDEDEMLAQLESAFVSTVSKPLVEAAKQNYGSELKPAAQKRIERKIKADADIALHREIGDYKIQRNIIERSRADALAIAETDAQMDEINARHDEQMKAAADKLRTSLGDKKADLVQSAGADIVREVETAKKEQKKQDIESGIRDHLRGFSRTIPSFLMAYGEDGTTLGNFDVIIPPEVFKEVTSITVDEFRFLRDGGDYTDEATGEVRHFDGNLFDPVVFNDSVKEFIRLRGELADYFDLSIKEDIFDYVPPQKTNQIFTPKRVVKQMVDLLEAENPGCFDDPDATFADLYMKSGLYIAEIITRLYNSEKMREIFPDDSERLSHIIERQVFGIAPTEIIYQIATHFILGYNGEHGQWLDSNFVCADSAAMAKEGKLAEFVEKAFGNKWN
ncbi:DEAD/DEAH box helicase family protein [Adlercreutzia sp. ZJ154]|uniref:DEAD/DEAH box helicase family protein n=1 Tax=Adlercreutzia sp. ZJ154 TaxID=2709790 RepID=UPI0013ED95E3|nr:DEAD/DEAH box helicase family protein [Adlercreutzia sp. ZJ154]